MPIIRNGTDNSPSGNPIEAIKMSAYPVADVDILDANIRGVVKQG
jgi:hypothetical protein